MKSLLNSFCVLLLFCVYLVNAREKPNLIYIVCDDLGYGDLGCYGQKVIKTPRFDQMAKEGLRFTDHYAGHTVCRPSRLVYLTGKHSGHTAIAGNNMHVLPKGSVTVTSLLKEAGYKTGGVGKWALGHLGSTGHPNKQGFDFFYGYLDQSEAHDYYPEHLYRNETKERLHGNVNSGKRNVSSEKVTYAHDRLTEEALAFIERNHKKPFYLNLTWNIPHTNNEAKGNGQEIPDHGIYKDEKWPEPEKGFAAMVTLMDKDMGKILDLLKKLKIEKNTLVIFTSDNGGAGGMSMGPLRGGKGGPKYEGHMRVPTLTWWPGTVPAGKVSHEIAATIDLLPSLAKLTGAKVPVDRTIDGKNVLNVLMGKPGAKSPHEILYYEIDGIRRGKWKLVGGKRRKLELYDLEQDLSEKTNLAGKHPGILKELKALLDAHAARIASDTRPAAFVEHAKPIISKPGDLPRLREYMAQTKTRKKD